MKTVVCPSTGPVLLSHGRNKVHKSPKNSVRKIHRPLPPPVFHSLHRIEDLSTAEQKPGKPRSWGTRETALGLPTMLSLMARGQDS